MITQYEKEAITIRRYLHTIPEPGWLEIETSIYLIEYLSKLGYDVRYGKQIHTERMGLPSNNTYINYRKNKSEIYNKKYEEIFQGYTGVVANFDTGKKGKHVAFRFDIDALKITEYEDKSHIPFRENFQSKNHGYMHACGHDGHMAIGLTFAKFLIDNSEKMKGKFTFIFQPAEEGVRGAKSMIASRFFPNPDYFFSLHLGFGLETGVVGVGTQGFLGSEHIEVNFYGKESHSGSKPEEGKNSLLAAAFAALSIQTRPQYGNGIARVNVGVLRAGTARNVIPGNAYIGMDIRADKTNIIKDMRLKTENSIAGAAKMYGNEYKMNTIGFAPCYNYVDKSFALKVSKMLVAKGIQTELYPNFRASEDVTAMMKMINEKGGQCLHFIIGADLTSEHHTNKFDFDESALGIGLKVLQEVNNAIVNS